ncbi:MAG: carbohydrate ABC transporter permease [Firmicutes bacterium]|nr:carbohydrate ABC transporter permease [Bacillota bacterium]
MQPVKKRNYNLAARIVLVTFFSLLSLAVFLPFYAIVLASFKPGEELVRYGLNLKLDWDLMSLANYRYLFTGITRTGAYIAHDYLLWFKNSVVLTVVQTTLTLFVSAWVGYGFAMYRFRGRDLLFTCVLLVLMIPFEILMLPMYAQASSMGLLDSIWGIMLPYLAHATTIFFFRQFLLSIPRDIVDAGRVDGASEYGIFLRLVLPLMKPALSAMAILVGLNSWNNFLWPMLVLRSGQKYTLAIGLNTLLTPYGNNYDILIAGSCFSIIPILILFLSAQKYFIEGMTMGSVKG